MTQPIAPLLAPPPELADQAGRMQVLQVTYQLAIRDGEFTRAKDCLLNLMRCATHSFAVCDQLERENRE